MKFFPERITIQNKTRRSRFTRMCIGEAIIDLMKNTDYESIKISDIAKRSGISRMTFYHYYDSKSAALTDYLDEIILRGKAAKIPMWEDFRNTHTSCSP